MPGLVKPSEKMQMYKDEREQNLLEKVDAIVMRPVPGLEDLIAELPDNLTMIEIGSFAGESTELFIRSGKVKKIICIDPWSDKIYFPMRLTGNAVFMSFQNRIAKLKYELDSLPEIVVSRRLSSDAAPLLKDNEYDFIYIDGDHSYNGVKEDINNYLPKLKLDGILAGHDYYPNKYFTDKRFISIFPDVPKCVDELIGEPDKVYTDTSWLKSVENINTFLNSK